MPCSSASARAKGRAVSRTPLPFRRTAAAARGRGKGAKASRGSAGDAMKLGTVQPSAPTSLSPQCGT
eukprot:12306605-Alexandrium_andersonii.AAC.1